MVTEWLSNSKYSSEMLKKNYCTLITVNYSCFCTCTASVIKKKQNKPTPSNCYYKCY